jgi:hypothetical protein
MREEQPMPAIMATFSGSSSSAAMALVSALSTPKSPQPAHHTGL